MKKITYLLLALMLLLPSVAQAQFPLQTIGSVLPRQSLANNITTDGQCTSLAIWGLTGIGVQVSGTWTGTLQFQVSGDGTNYQTVTLYPTNSTTGVTSTNANGQWSGQATGATHFQVCATAAMTGTAVVTLRAMLPGGAASGGGSAVTQFAEDAPHTTGDVGIQVLAVRNDAGAALATTTGDYIPLTTDSTGALRISGGAAGGTSSNFAAAFPSAGTAIGGSDGTNMQHLRVFDADSGAGTQYVVGSNLRFISNGGSVEAGTSSNPFNVVFPSAQAVSQSGTWNINNVSGTVSLPTGAATAAKQPALGTAGTPSADVISIQGVASGTVVPVTDAGVGATGDAAVAVGAAGSLTAKTRLMTSQLDAIQSSVAGTLTVNVAQVGGVTPLAAVATATLQSGATANGNGTPLATDGYGVATFTVNCSVSCSGGTTINLEGTEDGTNYVALSRAQRVDADVTGSQIVNQASGAITVWEANVTGLQAVRARISGYSAGTITVTARAVVATLSTGQESALGFRYSSAGSTEDEHQIKGTAGTLYSLTATNTNANVRYIRCSNATSANTTPGSTTPIIDEAIPAATTGLGLHLTFPKGLTFSTALTCWLVTEADDTGVSEVAANEIKVLYTYR